MWCVYSFVDFRNRFIEPKCNQIMQIWKSHQLLPFERACLIVGLAPTAKVTRSDGDMPTKKKTKKKQRASTSLDEHNRFLLCQHSPVQWIKMLNPRPCMTFFIELRKRRMTSTRDWWCVFWSWVNIWPSYKRSKVKFSLKRWFFNLTMNRSDIKISPACFPFWI